MSVLEVACIKYGSDLAVKAGSGGCNQRYKCKVRGC